MTEPCHVCGYHPGLDVCSAMHEAPRVRTLPLLTDAERDELDERLWRRCGIGCFARRILVEIEDIISKRHPPKDPS